MFIVLFSLEEKCTLFLEMLDCALFSRTCSLENSISIFNDTVYHFNFNFMIVYKSLVCYAFCKINEWLFISSCDFSIDLLDKTEL